MSHAMRADLAPAERLFQEYGAQLYRFCFARLRSREEAEDALQTTFLRAHRALERGDVPVYEAAWIYTIAHNVCLSRRASVARQAATIPLDDRELPAPESRRDELFGLSEALADLPANLRQAILLREWRGLAYAEIAAAMGTSVSAVETLIFRARRELAARLEGRRRSWFDGLVAVLSRLLSVKGATAGAAALLAAGGAGIGTAVELGKSSTGATQAPRLPIFAAVAVPEHQHAQRARAHAQTQPRTMPQQRRVVAARAAAPSAPVVHHRGARVAPEPAPAAPVVETTVTPRDHDPAAAPAPAPAPTPVPGPTTTVVTPPPPADLPPVSLPPLPPVDVPTVTLPQLP